MNVDPYGHVNTICSTIFQHLMSDFESFNMYMSFHPVRFAYIHVHHLSLRGYCILSRTHATVTGHPVLCHKRYTKSGPSLNLSFLSKTKCENIQCVNAASDHRSSTQSLLGLCDEHLLLRAELQVHVLLYVKCYLMIFISSL